MQKSRNKRFTQKLTYSAPNNLLFFVINLIDFLTIFRAVMLIVRHNDIFCMKNTCIYMYIQRVILCLRPYIRSLQFRKSKLFNQIAVNTYVVSHEIEQNSVILDVVIN